MFNKEEQENEILALSSIFTDGTFIVDIPLVGCQKPYSGVFSITVETRNDVQIIYEAKIHKLSFLPPVVLMFMLPPEYPSEKPPVFAVQCAWMTKSEVEDFTTCLLSVWEANVGSPILFCWQQTILEKVASLVDRHRTVEEISSSYSEKSSANCSTYIYDNSASKLSNDDIFKERKTECLTKKVCHRGRGRGKSREKFSPTKANNTSASDNSISDKSSVIDHRQSVFLQRPFLTDRQLFAYLIDYNNTQTQIDFERQSFSCEVCFDKKFGIDCVKFEPCGHIFCKLCVRQYFELRIREGNVIGMKCLATNCETEALQQHVKSIVDEELFSRYDDLLLRRTLESMADVLTCPRPTCQEPVIYDVNAQSMATCIYCGFTFCAYCKRTYHGVEPCAMTNEERRRVYTEYQVGDEVAKRLLEKRYGRRHMKQLVEDTLAEEWLSDNSKSCPNCKSKIEKNDGCNKMTCAKCQAYFCWLCLKVLHRQNPYSHFNNPQEGCFNQLFAGTIQWDEEMEEDPIRNWGEIQRQIAIRHLNDNDSDDEDA